MTRQEVSYDLKESGLKIAPDRLAAILGAAADIVLIVERSGLVKRVQVNPENKTLGRLDHWEGRNIRDFLTEESAPKFDVRINELSADAEAPLTLELNHADNANWEFPVRYSLLPTGEEDEAIMLGRDLRPVAEIQQQLIRTQMTLEKDYEKYRNYETRFRVLLDRTRDAVALVSAGGRIITLNAQAAQLLGGEVDALTGASFAQAFEDRQRAAFLDELRNCAGAAADHTATAIARRSKRTLHIAPTLFRSGGDVTLLCRLEPADNAKPAAEELRGSLHELYLNGPEAIVFTDAKGAIRQANETFLALCDLPLAADAAEKSLSEFLFRGGVDLKVLLDNAAMSGRMRLYATKLKSAFGVLTPVEISAAFFGDRSDPFYAFVIREASRGDAPQDIAVGDEAMRNVMELVGSAPLKDLVAATTDVVEKICIETAVQLTRNNRVAAAEMLGLSRQSLYVKLRKYGLLNKDAGDD
ncbi:MAG: transcriptional regulator PpsR [Pseudomonadota bacterium]